MDTKRILPWTHYDQDEWCAETKIENYRVRDVSYRSNKPDGSKFEAVHNYEWLNELGTFDTLDAAMDACEADYLARCTEFLRLAGPGEVVVNAQYLLSLVNATCKDTCQAYDSDAECAQCWVEMLRQESTAAIDAAKGEWK